MNTFAGKVILVTGSNSGIGRTTALAFAQQKTTVITTGLSEAEFDKVIATNLKSVWLCMKYEIQQMRCGRVEARSSTLPQWQDWLVPTWLLTLLLSTAF